jgi:hypothetical protein
LQQQKSGNMTARSFIEALASAKPAADRADKMNLYGWLIGRWTMDATVHLGDGGTHRGPGEIHFGWVLEGRAIQDMAPRCASMTPTSMPGTSSGAIRSDNSTPARSGGHRAATSFSSAKTMPAKPCAGASPK